MKSFAHYVSNRDLVEFIVDNEIDVDQFCEMVLQIHTDKTNLNEQNLNEFIQKLARGISGLAGMPFGMAKDAGSAALGAAKAAGGAVMNAAKAAGGAIASGAQAAGKYVGDKYEAGRRAEALKQVNDRIKGLENALVSLGLDKAGVSDFLGKINAHLQNAVKSGKIGTVQKTSDVRAQERQRQLAGGHAGWEAMGNTMAAQQRGRERYQAEFGNQSAPAAT